LPNSYISAVVKETLRLYPPGWLISRKACENDVLGDYPIPEGTDILISLYAIQRSGSNWEHPDKFFPERFLNDTTGEDSYLPFSTGPRKCIGDQLALMEMQIHLATMSRLFTIARVTPEQQIPVEAQINLRPAVPVYARVEATCTTLNSKQTNP
ncbi:MAG: cytochrome P450, partial [Flammeovirgaceae bacterium]